MKFYKLALCASSSILALNVAAYAAAPQAADQAVEEVIVTGSRIVRDGYEAPTPVTVVGSEQIQNSASANIADFVNQLPSISGSASPQSGNASLSAHGAGLSTIALRGLGANRTLILLDGQRSVGSTTQGLVDVNNIPQDLVMRVDVVTGGASAVYGSDALTGVVNFVLDRTYVGTKAEISGGLTSYGDDPTWKISLTNGSTFGGGRGHLLVSGEMTTRYGVWGVPREWNRTGALLINNPTYTATNGQPAILNVRGAVNWQGTVGGVITNTTGAAAVLKGIYFGANGQPGQFNFTGLVANPYAQTTDYRAFLLNNNVTLDPYGASQRLFTRASYDITDDITGFVQLSWGHNHAVGWDLNNFKVGNITVKADNAFIPAPIAAIVAANGITQFSMGSMLGDVGPAGNNSNRTTNRYVIGFDGHFDAMDKNWKWSVYAQKGLTRATQKIERTIRSDRFNGAAINAVDAVTVTAANRGTSGLALGSIVCRTSLTNPTNGCVPFNLFGTGVNSKAAHDYITSGASPNTGAPLLNEDFGQDVYAGSITGSPLNTWAGPVSLALDIEHRREKTYGFADPTSGNWLIGNYIATIGSYNVTEAALETVVPLAKDEVWARSLDFNAGVRETDYSLSGFVTTWKVGATWDVIPDLRLRATQSRDIRAPNLGEFFSTGANGTTTLIDRFHGTTPVNNIGLAIGNPNLHPEKADTTGFGVVVQPQFIPGLSGSVDYYNINIKDVIGTITGQTVIDYCFKGLQQFCSAITPQLGANIPTPTQIVVSGQPFNFANRKARGLDFEAGYATRLEDIYSGLGSGGISLRFLATHILKDIQDNNGLAPAFDVVGDNASASPSPKWKYNLSANYSNDTYSVTFGARGISKGTYTLSTANYLACTSGCPTSTTDVTTIDKDVIPAAWFYDLALNYTVYHGEDQQTAQVFLNVQNLFNSDPPIIAQGPTGIPYGVASTNPVLYDVMGRVFRMGVRLKM